MTVLMTEVYAFDERKVREMPVPSGTAEGTLILTPSLAPAITITPRGDSTITKTLGNGAFAFTVPNGAVGQRTDSAQCAFDGTWSGAVTGVTSGTAKGTPVYATGTAAGVVSSLTLTAGSNTKIGVVDSYPGKASAALCEVKIGANA